MYAINGITSESSLALYGCKKQKARLYSNFHRRIKGENDERYSGEQKQEEDEDANSSEGKGQVVDGDLKKSS